MFKQQFLGMLTYCTNQNQQHKKNELYEDKFEYNAYILLVSSDIPHSFTKNINAVKQHCKKNINIAANVSFTSLLFLV